MKRRDNSYLWEVARAAAIIGAAMTLGAFLAWAWLRAGGVI